MRTMIPNEPEHGHDRDEQALDTLLLSYAESLARGDPHAVPDESSLPPPLAARWRKLRECLGYLEAFAPPPEEGAGEEPHELPAQIGRFEIVRELGRGAHGLVFEAIDPSLGRRVALKVPRPEGLITARLRERFVREARAASVLEHPNLVPVFEVGADGPLCYIASHFCRGPDLAHWLKEQSGRVPIRDAVCAVASLAEGVEHAHRRGILHRDIKPGNVMLEPRETEGDTERGAGARAALTPAFSQGEREKRQPLSAYVPRLADFGLAKLIAPDATLTLGGPLGTPAYMAPEQLEAGSNQVGPPTDVYSLGTVLYELLVGQAPLVGEFEADTLRRVLLEDPLPPRAVRRDIPLELEAIVLKCLEKSPSRRYGTAGALAADLERHLRGERVEACRLTAVYRLQKFWRRNRVALATAAVVMAALLIGTGVSIWQAVEANVARERADDALGDLQRQSAQLTASNASLRRQTDRAKTNLDLARHVIEMAFTQEGQRLDQTPHLHATQWQLFQAVVEFYEGLPKQEAGDREVRWETGQAYFQLSRAYWRLNKGGESAKAVRRATEVYAELAREFPDVEEYQRELCHAHGFLGLALSIDGHEDQSQQKYIQAIAGYRKHLARFPDDAKAQVQLSDFLSALGTSYGAQHNAVQLLCEAVAMRERLVREHGEVPSMGEGLARNLTHLAYVLSKSGEFDEAIEAVRKGIGVSTSLVGRFPDHLGCREVMGEGHFWLARHLSARGNLTESERSEAIRSAREAIRLHHQLGVEVPDLVAYRSAEAAGYIALTKLLPDGEAEVEYRNWIECTKSLVTQFPEEPEYRDRLDQAYSSFVARLRALNRPQEADAWAQEAARWKESVAKEPRENLAEKTAKQASGSENSGR